MNMIPTEVRSGRARRAIEARKAAGTYRNNAPEVDASTARQIMRMANDGRSLRQIARLLELGQVPPARAWRWPHTTVWKVIRRERRKAAAA